MVGKFFKRIVQDPSHNLGPLPPASPNIANRWPIQYSNRFHHPSPDWWNNIYGNTDVFECRPLYPRAKVYYLFSLFRVNVIVTTTRRKMVTYIFTNFTRNCLLIDWTFSLRPFMRRENYIVSFYLVLQVWKTEHLVGEKSWINLQFKKKLKS